MNYNYFDVHSHLTEKRFIDTRDEIANQMKNQGIGTISIGVDQKESQAAVDFALKHDHVYASIGQHPVDNRTEEFEEKFYNKLLSENKEKVVCIGECGLDYYWISKELEEEKLTQEAFQEEQWRQHKLFAQQIDFAVKHDLPLMLHVRSYKDSDAHKDAFIILDEKQREHKGAIRANFHFFTETPEVAQQVVDRGFFISFPGVITFADLDATVATVPLEQMFSETDSPYAAPKPHRGELATPLMLPSIIAKIAEIKNTTEQIVQKQLVTNAQSFFNI